jgi:hypothetical protein
MKQLSADIKHQILLEYSPHDPSRSFAALAARHRIAGGKRTVQRWYQRWRRTPLSLKRRVGTGKLRMLTRNQIALNIGLPIRRANRAHRAVHYTALLPEVRQKTGKRISLRTLQRYGKEELKAKQKHTKKRTASESK